MQPDLLQQLRDFNPNAKVILTASSATKELIARAFRMGALARAELERFDALLKEARALYLHLHDEYQAGNIDAGAYLHETNELLKRMFIHGLKDDRARRANDSDWLGLLDERSGGTGFSAGPGRQLGDLSL